MPTPAQAHGMRAFRWDALFAGGVDSVVLNYLPLFALAYGGSNAEIGLLAAAMGLGAAAACFSGAWLSGRWRRRKPFILITRGVFANLLLLVFALGSLVAGPAALAVIAAAAMARSFILTLAESAWTSLATDLVPAGIRGQYFAGRNLFFGAGGLVSAGLVGLILTLLGVELGWAAGWGLVFGLGVASALAYSRIPEADLPSSHEQAGSATSPRAVLRDSRFLRYAATVVLWTISVQAAVPFFNVHLVKNLGASSAVIAGLFVVSAVFGLLGQAFIGRLLDLRGSRWMMAVAGIAISFLPVAWFFVDAPYQAGGINAVGAVLWAAYLLASFHLLLSIAPPGQQRYYVASYHTLVFLAMFAGPLLGGLVAEAYGIRAIFLLSGAGRLIAVLAFIALVQDVEAHAEPATRPSPAPGWNAVGQLTQRVRALARL